MTERTDRELLELAAKAAGIVIEKSLYNGGCEFGFDILGNAVLDWHNNKTWNPLTDDGDRYRLAKKLDIRIQFGPRYVTYVAGGICGVVRWPEDEPDDARAIVRAAAEIGAKP